MCAITRNGHDVEDRPSCERCLKVNCDLRRPPPIVKDNGGEDWNWKGWDEDIMTKLLISTGVYTSL